MIYEHLFDAFRFVEFPTQSPYCIFQLGLAQYQDYRLKPPSHTPYQFDSPRRLIGPFNYPLLPLETPLFCTREQALFDWEDIEDYIKTRLFQWQPPCPTYPLLETLSFPSKDGWCYRVIIEPGLLSVQAALLEMGESYRCEHRVWRFNEAGVRQRDLNTTDLTLIQSQYLCFNRQDVNLAIQQIQEVLYPFYPK